MNGFFLVDKPKNYTSRDVVNVIKKKMNLKKCGHHGTLDPNASGLMLVACDEATKLLKLIVDHDKTYIVTVLFGLDTDTLDICGKVQENIPMDFKIEELEECLKQLELENEQIPPIYSAIKKNGKKLYEYALKNQEVELSARSVKLYHAKCLSGLRNVDGHLEIDIELACSKGYYVRSFARDLGKMLHGCAIVKELRRIRSGNFSISSAVP